MNPLRRPAAAAHREGSPATGIDGSTPAEVDPGDGGGAGSLYRAGADPGGAATGAAHAEHPPRQRQAMHGWKNQHQEKEPLLSDEGDAVAAHPGHGRRFVLPLQASTSTLPSQCKNASLPTNLLDNIAMSCDA